MNIPESNSQVQQDVFVAALSMKHQGFFVEIGGFHSRKLSNTYLLERHLRWNGVIVEIAPSNAAEIERNREALVLVRDARFIDWRSMLRRGLIPREPDYLQVDCEPPVASLLALLNAMFASLRPKMITFEHDSYSDATLLGYIHQGKFVRLVSRLFLWALGYSLVAPNVCIAGTSKPFEDWWVLRGEFSLKPDVSSRTTNHEKFLAVNGLYESFRLMLPESQLPPGD